MSQDNQVDLLVQIIRMTDTQYLLDNGTVQKWVNKKDVILNPSLLPGLHIVTIEEGLFPR